VRNRLSLRVGTIIAGPIDQTPYPNWWKVEFPDGTNEIFTEAWMEHWPEEGT